MKNTEILPEDVYVFKGPQVGPSVAIFAGIHGDERVGIDVLEDFLQNVAIKRGTLYVAYANPLAIKRKIRMVNKNLNRCFYSGNTGKSYEDLRARALMNVLDKCDALLDLHAYDDTQGDPFTICEDNSLDLAIKLQPPIVSTNWTKAEPGGTDAYMYLNGKIGLCVECGLIKDAHKYKGLARKTIDQFLTYFDMAGKPVPFDTSSKTHIRAQRGLVRNTKDFWLMPGLHSFDRLIPGTTYCKSNGEEFIASAGEFIIFPKENPDIGTEAFVIGKEIPIIESKLKAFNVKAFSNN